MTLRAARILSSESDNKIKQEQNTNVNIKISKTRSESQECFQSLDKGVIDLSNKLDTLEKKNMFLELLIEMYSDNPLKINSYVVCKSRCLMDMIKLLTDCDKVDFIIDDIDVGCTSCCGFNSTKLIKIDKILITKENKTEELKYAYNDIYTEFIKYGLSLKFVV